MKKLLFLLAGALVAFTANAQASARNQDTQAAAPASNVETRWEGLCPDYGSPDGYLYAIFVKIEVTNHFTITGVDPTPYPARQMSDGQWEAAPEVLLDYKIWFDPADSGTVHCEFTYQYPGWPVRTESRAISYL